MKIVKQFQSKIVIFTAVNFYSREKSLYVAWVCFRNETDSVRSARAFSKSDRSSLFASRVSYVCGIFLIAQQLLNR